jgi:hypothetical protein
VVGPNSAVGVEALDADLVWIEETLQNDLVRRALVHNNLKKRNVILTFGAKKNNKIVFKAANKKHKDND